MKRSFMPDYDVVVIDAGNGGLTTVAGLNGHKTMLLEKNNVPGGCATSFAVDAGWLWFAAVKQISSSH